MRTFTSSKTHPTVKKPSEINLTKAIRRELKKEGREVFTWEFAFAMVESALRHDFFCVVDTSSRLREMKEARKFLDLGRGHGLYAIALARIFPNL